MRSMLRPMMSAKAVLRACAWGSVVAATVCCYSQQASLQNQSPESADQTPVFTLKVYTNRVQVPALVLDHDRQPLPRIDFRRIQLSLDSGKQFAPTQVRLEGEDPLKLAILIDAGGKQRSDVVADIAGATAEMAKKELHPQDRISIYLMTCNLLRTVHEVQPFPGLLSSSIEGGLQSPKLGRDSAGVSCGSHVHLWEATAMVIKDMTESPGRRAILIISDGRDDGSRLPWPKLHEYAIQEGVALFGLRENNAWPPWQGDHLDVFRGLCESTGGIAMEGDKRELQKRLQQWIELLRGRYIVEFPRPKALSTGLHNIVVSIKNDGLAFTTVAGVSFTLPDPKITSDPNYVPSDEGTDIPVGKRRVLPH
jgi:hypothetical protein